MRLMVERWRPVVGFEGQYEVSDQGRVRSLARVIVQKASGYRPACLKPIKERILRPGPQKGGHLTVALGRGNSKLVHVLVLEAFVGPRPEGREGCHGPGGTQDNRLSNLRWDTRSANVLDAVSWGKRTSDFYFENGQKIRAVRLRDPGNYQRGAQRAWATRRGER
jgi:hypothetical protein